MLGQIKDLINRKPPVGYFTQVYSALNMATTSTSTSVTWDIPDGVKTNFFTLIDIAIGSIIGWFAVVQLYHRGKDMHLW